MFINIGDSFIKFEGNFPYSSLVHSFGLYNQPNFGNFHIKIGFHRLRLIFQEGKQLFLDGVVSLVFPYTQQT